MKSLGGLITKTESLGGSNTGGGNRKLQVGLRLDEADELGSSHGKTLKMDWKESSGTMEDNLNGNLGTKEPR